jgi:hypothetical protein
MIYLKVPSIPVISGCIFRRLVEDDDQDSERMHDTDHMFRLLRIDLGRDVPRLFFLPRQSDDLVVEVVKGVCEVRTRGQPLRTVPHGSRLTLTALDSFLLLAGGTDLDRSRAWCIERVRDLRAAFPKIYAHILPTIVDSRPGFSQ